MIDITYTYSKPAAYFMWAVFGFFGKRQYCQACDQRVTPRNVGGFMKLEDATVGVWHTSLPCLLALSHYVKNRSESGGIVK